MICLKVIFLHFVIKKLQHFTSMGSEWKALNSLFLEKE